MSATTRRLLWLAASTLFAAGLHAAAPAGPHAWHWLHLVAQRLYFVPIILAAAWFGTGGMLGTTAAVSVLSAGHILRAWAGLPMVQAEELAQAAGFWAIGFVAAALFGRELRLREATRLAHEETLSALAGALELRERYTAGHSCRVRDYARLLADEMGLRDPAFLASLAQGALLHDIGKIGIPDWILLDPGPLGPAERSTMRRHPQLGASLVGRIGWLAPARELILSHHERYDGSGYPEGLVGEAIPLGARIFALADAFDALTTDRPYHSAVSFEEARSTLKAGRGSQFDPAVIDAFLRIPFGVWEAIASETAVALRRETPEASQPGPDGGSPPGLAVRMSASIAEPRP